VNILNIIVDAMGGDNAPNDIVKGCMKAIDEVEGFNVLLIGDAEKIYSI
jgi:glycerol-3-phosphate acyltransferase PlsX